MRILSLMVFGLFAASAAGAVSAQAKCDDCTSSDATSNQSLYSTMGPFKLAILNGEADAVARLNGAEASDGFNAAREAASQLTGIAYQSEEEAALAIIEIAETLR